MRKEGKAIILTPVEDYWEEFLKVEPIDGLPARATSMPGSGGLLSS
ncbi:hypothetical protein [Endozoicomonas sp. ALB091]